MPATLTATILNGIFYFLNGRTVTVKITGWLQAMNGSAAWATEAAKINRIRPAGKIGENKSMPPEVAMTTGTRAGFIPGKKPPKQCNILD